MRKKVLFLASLLFLGTALAEDKPLKFQLPEEDLKILKARKQKELMDLKVYMENLKREYRIKNFLFNMKMYKAKRNMEIERKKSQIFRYLSGANPMFTLPVKGFVGNVAVVDKSPALVEGAEIYSFKVEKVGVKGMVVSGQGVNVYGATEDRLNREILVQTTSTEPLEDVENVSLPALPSPVKGGVK